MAVTYPTRINPWTTSNDFTRSITRQAGIPLFDMLTAGGKKRGNRPYAGTGAKGGLFAGATKPPAASAPAKFPLFGPKVERQSGRNR